MLIDSITEITQDLDSLSGKNRSVILDKHIKNRINNNLDNYMKNLEKIFNYFVDKDIFIRNRVAKKAQKILKGDN